MLCNWCGVECPDPVWPQTRKKFCSDRCTDASYYQRHKAAHDAYSKAWAKRHPRKRRRISLRYQRTHAKAIYQRNKWREGERRARAASRKILLKIRPARCEAVGRHRGKIECHHRDGNPENLTSTNLMWLCVRHHRSHHLVVPLAEALGSSPLPAPTLDQMAPETSRG